MKPWVSGSPQDLSPPEVRDTWLTPRPPLRDTGWHSQENLGLLELCEILGEEGAAGACPPAAATRKEPLPGEEVGSHVSGVSSHPQLPSTHLCQKGYLNVKTLPLQSPVAFTSRTLGQTVQFYFHATSILLWEEKQWFGPCQTLTKFDWNMWVRKGQRQQGVSKEFRKRNVNLTHPNEAL